MVFLFVRGRTNKLFLYIRHRTAGTRTRSAYRASPLPRSDMYGPGLFALLHNSGSPANLFRPFFNAFILWNNEAVVHYCDLCHAGFHVLRGSRPQDAGTPSLFRPFRINFFSFYLMTISYLAIFPLLRVPQIYISYNSCLNSCGEKYLRQKSNALYHLSLSLFLSLSPSLKTNQSLALSLFLSLSFSQVHLSLPLSLYLSLKAFIPSLSLVLSLFLSLSPSLSEH
jgi:hypothetical protein